ncbi:primosomal protein N' [Chloroflexota bacterium]
MNYAEVSVNSPAAQRRTFSYAIPPGLSLKVGDAVWVPFGEKTLQGIVLELSPYPAVEETRQISGIIASVLSPCQASLARWISDYYLSSLFDAVALMLPPGFERKAITFVSLTPGADSADLSSLSDEQTAVIALSRKQGKVNLKEIEGKLGKKRARAIISQLVRQRVLVRSYDLEPIKVRAKQVPYIYVILKTSEVRQEAARLRQQRAIKQATLLDFLAEQTGPIPWPEARKKTGCTLTTATALIRKGLAAFRKVEVRRDPISYDQITTSRHLPLTLAQNSALSAIKASLFQPPSASPEVFLLHGVTGSGKTEIYLQALAEAVKQGKRGIVLVPEIALTPQTIERFASRFPRRVALMHSKLSLGEQFDEWQRIKNGEFDVVIGSRSAIFSPQPNLGLIIIDEEHEWNYKQSDKSPRYHTRDVAIKLAELNEAVVILGSATPDVETFHHARNERYRLLQLPERVVPSEGAPLPHVEIVDMREELKAGNKSVLSRSLTEAIDQTVANSKQVILFLNQRGTATLIQCRRCGLVLRCKHCEVSLNYHAAKNSLICHQCNTQTPVPQSCPRCSSRQIKFLGMGTQKLEQEASYSFPQAKQLRWDSDITRHKNAHEQILKRFRTHEADILIGTQMIAKGLDIPSITLVGVVSADTSLNLPDFRAGERTFQLLIQVAGRAGRGVPGGKVIIQTFSPDHYAIQAAASHDYTAFYEKEILHRRQLLNPPFKQLALLLYSHTNETICQKETERVKNLLITERDARGISDITFIGPTPAFFHRLRGRFRWQLIIRGSELSAFLSPVPFPTGWMIDIDPASIV